MAGSYTITMTATDPNGHTSAQVTQATTILPVSVTIGVDPRNAAKPALLVTGSANAAETIVLSPGAGNGVMVSINGTSVGNLVPSGTGPFGIRATSAMNGVPLAERREQLKCGVAVVDLRDGRLVALLEFQTAVEEIFDVQVLPGLRFPEVIGFQQEAIQHTFIVPSGENRGDTIR